MAGILNKDEPTDVLGALRRAEPPVPTDVGVEFDDGVVTLAGTISTWAKMIADEQIAHRACGLFDAADDADPLAWDGFEPDDEI